MKTILRGWAVTVFIIISQVFISKLYSQCVVSDIFVQKVVPAAVQSAGSCVVTFDVSFTIENNNGNKFIFIHAWTESDYPNYFNCTNGEAGNGATQAPEGSDLANAFLNIGIDNSGDMPTLLTEYPADPSVTLTTVASIDRELLPDGSAIIILSGVTVTLPFIVVFLQL